MAHTLHPPIFQTVPADEFTDRAEIIGHLLWLAERTPADLTISTSVVGRRRLGKTAVLEQVYNRLFWEQDAVVPFYFNFEDKPTASTEFADRYFRAFVGQYVAFRLKDPACVKDPPQIGELAGVAQRLDDPSLQDVVRSFLRSVGTTYLYDNLAGAIKAPRRLMEDNRFRGLPETPIFVMLDEFQEVMKIYYSNGTPADAVGMYQWAVEGRKAPHIVTGSAIRLINQEVLGTGALFGRFRYLEFPPLEDIFGLELTDKLAHKYHLQIEEPVAGYLVTRCGGSPFYIQAVLWQAVEQHLTAVPNAKTVDELLAHELTHGLIWRDWSGQLQKYFEQINSHRIAKRVLFHAAQAGDAIIEPETIAAEVKRPADEVQRVLRQLAFADMIDTTGGYILRNVKDPILREFIRVQYRLDVVGEPFTQVLRELQVELARWKGKYADAIGELVEARIAALLHRFDGRRVPGRLFHTAGEVELPKFAVVYDTVVKGPGDRQRQADVLGSLWDAGGERIWVAEIKHWARRVDAGVVAEFLDLCQALGQETKVPQERMTKWLVNAGGFTAGALAAMQQAKVFYSGVAEINELLAGFGLNRLLRETPAGGA